MDNHDWAQVHQAFLDYKVIAIRDQDLSPQDLMDVGARFGEPNHYPFVKGMDDFPFLFDIVKEPSEKRNFGGGWHSDTTYMKTPPLATLLYALETPERGGDTLYCDMVAAYESLSDRMKEMLGTLKGVNSAGLKHLGGRKAHHSVVGGMKITGTEDADSFEAVHPIVRTVEETGQKALYCSIGHTVSFEGMTPEAAQQRADDRLAAGACDAARIHLPPPLEARHAHDLGQPAHDAQRDQRLSRHAPPHAPPDLRADEPGLSGNGCFRSAREKRLLRPSRFDDRLVALPLRRVLVYLRRRTDHSRDLP
jgi:alpha-ketoglutarate-dependent taurine dioxygenase